MIKKWKVGNLSTQKYYESANLISAAFIEIGIKPQDKIALISSNNRSEWSIIDMAILQLGAITVPLYPNISSNDYKYILNHSRVYTVLFRINIFMIKFFQSNRKLKC